MATKMAHAALTVQSTQRCHDFYCGLLGMKVAVDFPINSSEIKTGDPNGTMHVTLLSDDEGSQCIETFEFIGTESRRLGDKCRHDDYWSSHIALCVDDLKSVFDKLVEAGIEVSIPYTDAAGYKFAYVYDYDGFLVELIDSSTY